MATRTDTTADALPIPDMQVWGYVAVQCDMNFSRIKFKNSLREICRSSAPGWQ